MASSGNFATFNPLKYKASSYTTSTISNGNMKLPSGTGNAAQLNIGFVNGDGKFYFECYVNNVGGSVHIGVCIGDADLNNVTSGKAIVGVRESGNKLVPSSSSSNSSSTSYGASFTTGDYIACAIDFTNSTFIFYKNNSSQGSFSWSGANDGTTYYPYIYCNAGAVTLNCGQDGTFLGVTTGGNADENGFGDFKYSVPSGYLAMCSGNLPISDDIDPAQTDDDYPQKNFNAIIYTGTGSTNAITGLGFQPDLVWIKRRNSSATYSNGLVDSSRGRAKVLISNLTNGEYTSTSSQDLVSFDSDGFTLGTNSNISCNGSSDTHVAWAWRCNGGTTSSNGNGSITSTVQANTKAGFSIATYTSPNSSSNQTVGHGLSGVDFVITKNRSATFNWYCFHSASSGKTYRLNSGTEHSYSNWSMGATTWGSENGYTHDGTSNFVAYAWQNVAGMQHFSSYTGNGNADGPFVYTGFRPRLIFTLLTNSSSGWRVRDTARDTYNPSDSIVWWNEALQEYNSSGYNFDILSNGFKVRNTGSDFNTDGSTYLYGAWGDVPFKYNNTF